MSTVSILLIVIGVGIGLILAILLPLVVYQSLYKIGADEKVVFYFWGSYSHVYVNETYYELMWLANSDVSGKVDDADSDSVRVGWWQGGLCFGLWPFYLGYKVPTDQFDVPIHASQAYTSSEEKGYPRVRIEIDATLQFRLSDNLRFLGLGFPLFRQDLDDYLLKTRRDLTNSDVIVMENGGEAGKEHKVKRIALLFYRVINRPMLEAVRTAATAFTFSTTPSESGSAGKSKSKSKSSSKSSSMDIVSNRQAFEDKVMEILADGSDTIFRQARLLKKNGKPGKSLLVCNYVGEDVQLSPKRDSDSEALKAIDLGFIGEQEGKRLQVTERLRRLGEAQGIEELANRLGLTNDKQRAYLLDVLREREGSINLSSVDLTDTKDILAALQDKLDSGTP